VAVAIFTHAVTVVPAASILILARDIPVVFAVVAVSAVSVATAAALLLVFLPKVLDVYHHGDFDGTLVAAFLQKTLLDSVRVDSVSKMLSVRNNRDNSELPSDFDRTIRDLLFAEAKADERTPSATEPGTPASFQGDDAPDVEMVTLESTSEVSPSKRRRRPQDRPSSPPCVQLDVTDRPPDVSDGKVVEDRGDAPPVMLADTPDDPDRGDRPHPAAGIYAALGDAFSSLGQSNRPPSEKTDDI